MAKLGESGALEVRHEWGRVVWLAGSNLTDADLEHLKGLTNLNWLSLYNTEVTDAGLEHLKGLTELETLHLNETQVTEEGVKELQQALPNCRIEH